MRSHAALAGLVLAAALLAMPGRPASETPADPHARVRGMTVTCPGAGRIWGTDAMVETMQELKALGVNWVAIHPYAAIRRDGTVGGTRMDSMYDDPTWITRPIAEAHRLGMKILVKPHIAYWGSGFAWRGEIEFDSPEEWDRFFETYEDWIVRVAELSREADAFAVGTELDRTVRHDAEWREIIGAVRRKTSAVLTYSASWDRFEKVRFWDALDSIAIQGYFPLVDHDGLPTMAELDRSWAALVERLDAFSRRWNRNVVLGELGYNLSSEAALRPWAYEVGGPNAEEVQRRCLTAALKALDGSQRVTGAFLWKWFPGHHGRFRGNFLKSSPAMREVIAGHWGT